MKEWIYSPNSVYECLRAHRRQVFRLRLSQGMKEHRENLAEIVQLSQARKITVERVSRNSLDSIATGHQGVALEVSGYPYRTLADMLAQAARHNEPPLILVLDVLQDPQNLGTLLRTAEAVGVHGVLLPFRHTATVTPAVVNASSGATEHLLIAQANLAQSIQQLKEANVWVIGLDAGVDAQPVDKIRLDGPLALVVGGEGSGMRSLVRKSCDGLMRLPMRGQVTSLNAAVAGSIALYFAWQSRDFNPKFIDDIPKS